ncbi:MAG: hypothetical protein AAF683_01405 [Pseudomonadota bacterium]
MLIRVEAESDFDLAEAYNRILDGELGHQFTEESVSTLRGKAALFGGGNERLSVVTIYLKDKYTSEELIKLKTKLREIIGSRAHIHIKE